MLVYCLYFSNVIYIFYKQEAKDMNDPEVRTKDIFIRYGRMSRPLRVEEQVLVFYEKIWQV
jgi:hypothetical protein